MSSWSERQRGVRLLLGLSRWLGVSPPGERLAYPHLIWSLLLLGCVWFYTLNRLITMKFYKQVLTIQKLFYFAEYPANMLLTAIFSLRIYRSARFYIRLWLQLCRLQALLFENGRQLCAGLEQQHVLRLLCVIIGFHAVCAVVDSAWLNFDWRLSLPSNCAHQLPSLMISLSLLQYVLAQRLLCLFYAQLNQRLAQLRQRLPIGICVLALESQSLEQLRLAAVALDSVQAELLARFGFVLLLSFGNSLLSLSYEVFNVFRLLELAQLGDWVLYCYRSLWLLLHGSRIWFVLRVNERIVEQKCQLCLLLNQLEASDTRLERSINRFLLQLQTNQAQPPAACGLIDLDTLSLGGFVNALLVIVIFLIQIDLGNKSLRGFV
ncbi:putative gustatory receptor 59e [Drosophila montana]|uniref:putative gustatory receptor 59e n=1 Tax=Drosophila montana TaxID=40370 RepID=UPI00313C2111